MKNLIHFDWKEEDESFSTKAFKNKDIKVAKKDLEKWHQQESNKLDQESKNG